MRARSLKRQRQIREYIPLAEAFLEENTNCQFPDCELPSEVVHHQRGRFGSRLLDQRFWAASCDEHNNYAETDTGAALACNWLIRIEGATP